MARGKTSPAPAPALPVVSFTKVLDGPSNKRAGVTDAHARSFGCAFVYVPRVVTVLIRGYAQITTIPTFEGQIGIYATSVRGLPGSALCAHVLDGLEPLESDLAVQVEYDMDEQDQEWLDAVNQDRKQEQCGTVSYEVFEVIMDRLEKEWFDLVRQYRFRSPPRFAMLTRPSSDEEHPAP